MDYCKGLLSQFKNDYRQYGKYRLDIQIPHLSSLADYYHNKYKATRDWPDCVKVRF